MAGVCGGFGVSDVFISYVHEDSRLVHFLSDILKANGVSVWLDRDRLIPGQRWKSAIRQAIKNGTYFISIHSKKRNAKEVSHVNEELMLAIDEIRKRPATMSWFIPVKIDDCELDDRQIGGGETLSDLQWCDLRDWAHGVGSLLNALGVKEPKFDHGLPLAKGLPSVVKIRSGFVRYDYLPGLPEYMQGLEFRVVEGWCQREEDGSILAYIETVAPMTLVQEFNKQTGLSGFLASCKSQQLSDDPGCPSEFEYQQDFLLKAGARTIDFSTGAIVAVPFDFNIRTKFQAVGHICEMRFSGRFTTQLVSLHPSVPMSQKQSGVFEVDFSPDFPAP
ncbi:MAG: toll/interleukin-1 receptor domain-containing protein [Rhodobacteraceae bacterium]|nr:MAG: toll/interleukin-1 receptor domain-containing protein [Paracoccaceae bacterium]